MLMKKIVPYKLRKSLIKVALFAAPVLFNTSCEKNDDPIIQHDVTLDWGPGYYENIHPVSKIAAAAKPDDVRYVILQVNDEPFGITTNYLRVNIFNEAFALSPKIKGAGELHGLDIASKEDSLFFVNHGFTFHKQR